MITDVKRYIPHRKPFLFVDAFEVRPDKTVTGTRRFTEEDFFFAGHFPGYPVVPGVILVESMAQCGGAGLVWAELIPYRYFFFLATIKDAKFRRQVVCGDTARFEVATLRLTKKLLRQRGMCYVGDELAAEAEWLCVITPQTPPEQRAGGAERAAREGSRDQ